MSSYVIKIKGLGKEYIIGGAERNHSSFREMLASTLTTPFRRLRQLSGSSAAEERIWALKDVSFAVEQGEVVGIIGRNGAGKSTLLKLLSRITAPTEGRITIRGRVSSLLEVGTGFHQELTGRENIYLNSAILGMGRKEVENKFDEIVDFSGVERFLDTPVKRYSSGMAVRLAFAVAAHLDPEILIVDEVLAVGDAAFQKKCLSKMGEVAGEGRTVLFVSHNQHAIRALCTRGILLSEGKVIADGPVDSTLETYRQALHSIEFDESADVTNAQVRRGNGAARFTAIRLMDDQGRERNTFSAGETLRIEMHYQTIKPIPRLYVSIVLYAGHQKTPVTSIYRAACEEPLESDGCGYIEIDFPKLNLRPGEYALYFWLGASPMEPYDVVDGIIPPLTIEAARASLESLDYDPVNPMGYFDLPAKVRCYSKKKQLNARTAANG
jgi:lipopolysaccharide transport system ATP-binding protein